MVTEESKKPSKLYKYVDLDILNIILADQTLKFSAPADFNDPLIVTLIFSTSIFSGKINSRVTQEIEIIKNEFKNNELVAIKQDDLSFWENSYKSAQILKVKSFRICCFSLQNNITLMWSHYANKHTGVCLEFDNFLEKKFFDLSNKDISEGEVGYELYKRINYISEDRYYAFYKLFLNKDESWRYEKEYRIILMNKLKIQKFYPNFLLSIYFGLKVTESQIAAFVKKFRSSPEFRHLKYYKAIKNNLSIEFLLIEK